MKKSIVVSIIESKLFPKDIGCHSIFSVREQNTGHRLCDRLEFHFLELGKVDPRKPLEEICAEFIQRLFPGKKEKDYKDLTPSYVIFICMKDPFEMGEAVYQFQMIDKNLQLQLNDETYIMSLSQRLASWKRRQSWWKTDVRAKVIGKLKAQTEPLSVRTNNLSNRLSERQDSERTGNFLYLCGARRSRRKWCFR